MAPRPTTNPMEAVATVVGGYSHRRWTPWLAVVFLIAMFSLMLWVSRQLKASTQDLTQRAVLSVLEGNVATVRLYIAELQRNAQQLANTPAIAEAIDAVMEDASNDKHLEKLSAMMPLHPHTDAWMVTDREGQIVACSDDRRIGQLCGWSAANADRMRRSQPALVSPSDSDLATPASWKNADSVTVVEEGLLVVLAPLTAQHQLRGTVGWVANPRSFISDSIPITPTYAAYLFDRHARILTRNRFADEPIVVDLAKDPELDGALAGSTTVVAESWRGKTEWQPVVVHDPGLPLESRTAMTADALSKRPLTKCADQAIRGSSGTDMDGYRDYRGEQVVGAWQWLPEYELAMAMEIDVADAYHGVQLMQWLIIVLFSVLFAAGIGVAALAIWSARLGQRFKDRDHGVRRLGQYELTELLGAGGMGTVYRGRHQYLRRDVAIKVLEGEDLSLQAIERFRREVQLTSTLRHPNTIAIYDYGQAHRLIGEDSVAGGKDSASATNTDGVFYYVMEYVDGISLQQLIDFYGPQEPARVVHLLLQVCGSIAEAHTAGLIHRDIKPANILLSAQSNSWDFIKVLDFGLVKELGKVDDTVALTMTRSDSITGTPLYMAPETIRDATQATTSGDLYSIGAVGYALLTGQTTYEGDSAIDLCLKQLEQPPLRPDVRLGRPLPSELQDLIMSCLSLRPSDRPASIHELLQRLDELPESAQWNQVHSTLWWETVFEANRQKTPVPTKNPTVANLPISMMS